MTNPLVRWKIEGTEPLNGLNVYKPSDPCNVGFILKLGNFQFKMRYSRITKHFHWGLM
jgi:hypothetical protein